MSTQELLSAMRVELPLTNHRGVVIDQIKIDQRYSDFTWMRAMMNRRDRDYCPPGTYTRLIVDDQLWMSDTRAERLDHLGPLLEAEDRGGRVLVNGLGLGAVVKALLTLPQVEHVDVVELDQRIVDVVGPHYAGERCMIHHADAYTITWPAGTRWTVAWHDIWPSISSDNLPGMIRLHRRYGHRVDWQGSWARDEARGRY